MAESQTMEVKGRDLVSGIPKTLYINDTEIREALADVCSSIVQAVRNALESTPPELSSDIVDRGIVLAGGGSLLKGLDLLLRDQTGLPVMYAEDPLSAVANGTGKVLDELDLLSTISLD
jgi:rod shape-determining protein MreB|tara:strand:+ start:220 stop:576 length:357 start_codon:yes stop_codon:yes gene_type:complete